MRVRTSKGEGALYMRRPARALDGMRAAGGSRHARDYWGCAVMVVSVARRAPPRASP